MLVLCSLGQTRREDPRYFLPNISFSNRVVCVAGSLQIFFTFSPSTRNRPSSILPSTYLFKSNCPAKAGPLGALASSYAAGRADVQRRQESLDRLR